MVNEASADRRVGAHRCLTAVSHRNSAWRNQLTSFGRKRGAKFFDLCTISRQRAATNCCVDLARCVMLITLALVRKEYRCCYARLFWRQVARNGDVAMANELTEKRINVVYRRAKHSFRTTISIGMAAVALATSAEAAIYTVQTNADAGMGSLRWAIQQANTNQGLD